VSDDDYLEKTLSIAAPPERVFAALTDSDQVSRWFAPITSIELQLGGRVEFVFYNRNGTFSLFQGQVTAVDAPWRFGFTWHSPAWAFAPLDVQFTLEAAPDGTRLRLIQRGFATQPVERDIHDVGWEHYLRRLAAVADGSRPEGWNELSDILPAADALAAPAAPVESAASGSPAALSRDNSAGH
jgi:uncharacterized protein YndB with AHSA1/START domain